LIRPHILGTNYHKAAIKQGLFTIKTQTNKNDQSLVCGLWSLPTYKIQFNAKGTVDVIVTLGLKSNIPDSHSKPWSWQNDEDILDFLSENL